MQDWNAAVGEPFRLLDFEARVVQTHEMTRRDTRFLKGIHMIDVSATDDAGFLEVHVSGEVTDADYKIVLEPAIERAIEKNGAALRVLVIFEEDVSYSLKAMMDDAELGLLHWSGFDRIAVVASQHVADRLE